nr:MAG TPA: hypothetical protein [Caudoviricetes sp.]
MNRSEKALRLGRSSTGGVSSAACSGEETCCSDSPPAFICSNSSFVIS